MNNKLRKKFKIQYAKKNIDFLFNLLDLRFNPDFDKEYIKDILRLSQGFNIRLTREEKLKFCKKCKIYWNAQTRQIRFNPTFSTKEYICKNCGFTRRFKYK